MTVALIILAECKNAAGKFWVFDATSTQKTWPAVTSIHKRICRQTEVPTPCSDRSG